MPAIETAPTDHTPTAAATAAVEAQQKAGPQLTMEQYFTEPNNKDEIDCECYCSNSRNIVEFVETYYFRGLIFVLWPEYIVAVAYCPRLLFKIF